MSEKYDMKIERDAEVARRLEAVVRALDVRCAKLMIARLVRLVTEQPAPRFYISELRAQRVIRKFLQSKIEPERAYGNPLRMQADLFRTFLDIRRDNPHLTFQQLVAKTVYSPAHSFYISEREGIRILKELVLSKHSELEKLVYTDERIKDINNRIGVRTIKSVSRGL